MPTVDLPPTAATRWRVHARLLALLLAGLFIPAFARAATPPTISNIVPTPLEGSTVTEGSNILVSATVTNATSVSLLGVALDANGGVVSSLGFLGTFQSANGNGGYTARFNVPNGYRDFVGGGNRLGLIVNAENTDANGSSAVANSDVFGKYTLAVGPGTADLSLVPSVSQETVAAGRLVSYQTRVNNFGPNAAPGTVFTFQKDRSATFDALTSTPGVVVNGDTLTYAVGDLAASTTASVIINLRLTAPGSITQTLSVASNAPDPNPENNAVAVTTTVTPAAGTADLALTVTDDPDTVPLGGLITYTATVRNLGPDQATSISLNFIKDSKTTYVPAGSSGNVTVGEGNNLYAAVGTLDAGASTEVKIVLRGDQVGVLTVGASANGAQTDPVTSNNILTTTSEVVAGNVTPRPDVTLALANPNGFTITSIVDPATKAETVRLAASVVARNAGTSSAPAFDAALVLSFNPTYSKAALLTNPATGAILRGNIPFADFARINGLPAANLPAGVSFDPFSGSYDLDGALYRTLIASPTPVYAYAVADLDGKLTELSTANNAVRLGVLTAPSTGPTPNPDPAPFTLAVKGISPGETVLPGDQINVKAKVSANPDAGAATVAEVRFFLDGRSLGTADGNDNGTFKRKLAFNADSAGDRTLTAVLTDSAGRTAASAAVPFRIAQAGSGSLALDTLVEPADGTVVPGGLITYNFVVTNTAKTFTATNVRVDLRLPREAVLDRALILNGSGQKLRIQNPDGSKNPLVSPNGRGLGFYLGDLPRKESLQVQLTVRVPYNAREGGEPVSLNNVRVSGVGLSGSPIDGVFTVPDVRVVGVPTDAPRLILGKTVFDRPDDPTDDFGAAFVPAFQVPAEVYAGDETVQDSYYVPSLSYGEKITVLLFARNFGSVGADKVTVKDQIPEGFELVPGSARLNDRAAQAQFFSAAGNKLTFSLVGLQPDELATLSYQMVVKAKALGGPAPGYVVAAGAELRFSGLNGSLTSTPRNLPIQIANGPILNVEALKYPATNTVGQAKTYYLGYSNNGGRTARGVSVRALLPVGVTFVSATGGQLQADGRTVVFPLGDLAGGTSGTLVLGASVSEAAKTQAVTGQELLTQINDDKFYPVRTFATGGGGETRSRTTRAKQQRSSFNGTQDPLQVLQAPQLAASNYAPQSIHPGETYQQTVKLHNVSNNPATAVEFRFTVPTGAEFVSLTTDTKFTNQSASVERRNFLFSGSLNPHGDSTFTFILRAVGAVGQKIVNNNDTFGGTYARGFNLLGDGTLVYGTQVFTTPSATLVIDGDAALPDNQAAIARAQLETLGLDASAALANPAVAARIRAINANSYAYTISRADYVSLNGGGFLLPLGGGRIVAAGGGNLIGQDGASLIGQDGGSIVAAGGGNLVAAGGGNLIQINRLIGQDGGSLIGQDAASLLANLVAAGGGNLVAAGGGNIVAAGGGNLVAAGGGNLISNTGGFLGTSIAPLVAAGGGNLVAAGGGNLVAAGGGNLIGQDGGSLIGQDGGSLVAAGGGNLVAAGGGNLLPNGPGGFLRVKPTAGRSTRATQAEINQRGVISNDRSRAAAIGADGTFTFGGNGFPVE